MFVRSENEKSRVVPDTEVTKSGRGKRRDREETVNQGS